MQVLSSLKTAKNDTATAKLSAEKAKCTSFARAIPRFKARQRKRPNPIFQCNSLNFPHFRLPLAQVRLFFKQH